MAAQTQRLPDDAQIRVPTRVSDTVVLGSCAVIGRPHSSSHSLALGLLTGSMLSGAIALSTSGGAKGQFIDVDDIHVGMKGYGLTVLRGTVPERFGVEVIGKLHNFRPQQDLILIKTKHPRLSVAKTVAGMSGSPVYLDGKLAGAYAYGWFFNVEPIAGVTPIANMMAELRRPIPRALAPVARSAPLPGGALGTLGSGLPPAAVGSNGRGHRFIGSPLGYDLREHARQVATRSLPALAPPGGAGLRPASTDVMIGGLMPRAYALAGELLEQVGMTPIQAGTGGGHTKAKTTGRPHYVDGGVLTVELVRGDVSVNGLGTVTHVVGDRLVAFGHPMLNGGFEDLPTALGTVHWILSAQNRSFKIGEPTTPLGALVNDRQASIVVDTKRRAATFPVSVSVSGVPGAPKTSWHMEVAHDQFLAPTFAALAIGSALEATTAERSDMTWTAHSTMRIAGHGTIAIDDFGAGARMPIGPSDIARSRLTRALGALLNNPWQRGRITGIETRVRVTYGQETMRLRGSQLLEREIDVGQPARVRLTFEPHLGKRFTKIIEIPIDRSLAGKKVRIKLEPGYRVQRIVPAPESYDELVRVLPKLNFPGRSLVASYALPKEAGAAFEGKVAHRLPPGATNTLRATTKTVAPDMFGAVQQVVIPLPRFVSGKDTLEVKVREVLR